MLCVYYIVIGNTYRFFNDILYVMYNNGITFANHGLNGVINLLWHKYFNIDYRRMAALYCLFSAHEWYICLQASLFMHHDECKLRLFV